MPEVRVSDSDALAIRAARVQDVHGMSALINQYASSNVMLARGPQYLYQHIQDYMVATAPAADTGRETVVACGSVHVLWEDLAEIRSVAVHASCQGQGLGRRLVGALVERCRGLGIPQGLCVHVGCVFFRGLRF